MTNDNSKVVEILRHYESKYQFKADYYKSHEDETGHSLYSATASVFHFIADLLSDPEYLDEVYKNFISRKS